MTALTSADAPYWDHLFGAAVDGDRNTAKWSPKRPISVVYAYKQLAVIVDADDTIAIAIANPCNKDTYPSARWTYAAKSETPKVTSLLVVKQTARRRKSTKVNVAETIEQTIDIAEQIVRLAVSGWSVHRPFYKSEESTNYGWVAFQLIDKKQSQSYQWTTRDFKKKLRTTLQTILQQLQTTPVYCDYLQMQQDTLQAKQNKESVLASRWDNHRRNISVPQLILACYPEVELYQLGPLSEHIENQLKDNPSADIETIVKQASTLALPARMPANKDLDHA